MADTKFTITIPEAQATRVLEGVAGQHGYQDTIDESPNPQTKKSFIKEKLVYWVKANVKSYEANLNAETARLAAIQDVDENITVEVT